MSFADTNITNRDAEMHAVILRIIPSQYFDLNVIVVLNIKSCQFSMDACPVIRSTFRMSSGKILAA